MTKTCALVFGLLAACQTDSIDPTTTTEQEATVLGDFCDAKFPALTVWNGASLPQLTSGQWVVLSTPYPGWTLFSLVDTVKATIPYSTYVHDSMMAKFSLHMIRLSIAGPGGNPPPPPCESGPTVRCGQWVVAYALHTKQAVSIAYDDAKSCLLKSGTLGL